MSRNTLIVFSLICLFSNRAGATGLAYVLKLPESVRTVLVAETTTATLHRFDVAGDDLVKGDAQQMSIGQNGVGKTRTGDRRTPLGIYFVVEELDTTNLHEKYGPVAFPLDYPNAWDAYNERTGYGIWIHGVTPGSGIRPERDTDGCIAIQNEQLLSLQPYLEALQVPVIVTRELRTSSAEQAMKVREQLLLALGQWVDSYRSGDWQRYLSMYADDFVYRGMSRDEWVAFRLKSTGAKSIEDFAIDEILLLADPEEEQLFLSRFRQTIIETGRTLTTTKRLYWQKTATGELQIVAEDNG